MTNARHACLLNNTTLRRTCVRFAQRKTEIVMKLEKRKLKAKLIFCHRFGSDESFLKDHLFFSNKINLSEIKVEGTS